MIEKGTIFINDTFNNYLNLKHPEVQQKPIAITTD